MGERRNDTRERIKSVALELFAEQGYEKTSLREIAEKLDVTKAALYYHFKTKEDIVGSLFDEFHTDVEVIIDWGHEQPVTSQTRAELVRRYADLMRGRAGALMRFVAENQADMRDLKPGEKMREQFKRFADLITDKAAPPADQLRARLALFSLHASLFLLRDLGITEPERHAVALEVALDLASTPHSPTPDN